MPQVTLTVNGKQHTVEVEGRTLLVELLREQLRLTGTHVGCDTSQCGACTVHVDGKSVKSCTMLALQADGADGDDDRGPGRSRRHAASDAGSVPRAHGLQCGFCTPGMVMSAIDLVQRNPTADRGRDPRRARRQPLPLHRLPQHRQGRAAAAGR